MKPEILNGGLKQRYNITHADGTPVKPGTRFVLNIDSSDPIHAAACCNAMRAYASYFLFLNPQLWQDVLTKVRQSEVEAEKSVKKIAEEQGWSCDNCGTNSKRVCSDCYMYSRWQPQDKTKKAEK